MRSSPPYCDTPVMQIQTLGSQEHRHRDWLLFPVYGFICGFLTFNLMTYRKPEAFIYL
ncbi:hypothetical protein BDV09DRAFT_73892 [Aspergillus tetrazonus]